jgi:hypothetical protein
MVKDAAQVSNICGTIGQRQSVSAACDKSNWTGPSAVTRNGHRRRSGINTENLRCPRCVMKGHGCSSIPAPNVDDATSSKLGCSNDRTSLPFHRKLRGESLDGRVDVAATFGNISCEGSIFK